MGLEIRGINSTKFRLDNVVNRTNRRVYDLLERAAQEAKKRIELQAYRDTGALEKAVRTKRIRRGGMNGRTSFEVYIDPNVRRMVRTRNRVTRQRVITYARKLEEGRIRGQLGPRSRAKNESIRTIDSSLSIGPGFIGRSMKFVEVVYRRKIEQAVRQITRSG